VLFNSYIFLFTFLPIVILFFFFFNLYKKKIFLFLSILSVIFYCYDSFNSTILFLISTAVNYYFSILIDSTKNFPTKKKYLISVICINILILLYFKYYNFFANPLSNILNINIKNLEIYLPLAISFYTFQQISFQIDNYKKKQKKNFLQYLLYLFFFPQLIAGPIIRYSYFIKESLKKNFSRVNAKNLTIGISIIIIGLSKKIIFADSAGLYVDQVYNKIGNGELIAGVDYFFFIILFSVQIYYDFSGYSDIAVGTGKILNFNIPVNFNSPYKSKSIIEFWKKWHVSLSQFFRDYLYIYIGGNRNGIILQIFIIFFVMTIVGFWHGASTNFIFWGFLHGVYISVNHLLKKIDYRIFVPDFCKIIFTFLLVSIAFIFFRVDSFENSLKILAGSLNFPYYFTNSYLINHISLSQKLTYVLSLICIFYFPNIFQIFKLKSSNIKNSFNNSRLAIRFESNYIWLLYLVILSVFLLANLANPQTFIYFRF
jgi:D-alanyl-lipoteichoic acid acyltransferase DltB (MBOAT superfamily)